MILGHVSIAYIGTYYLTGSTGLSIIAGVLTNIPDYFYYIQKDYSKIYNTLHKPHTKFSGWKLWFLIGGNSWTI